MSRLELMALLPIGTLALMVVVMLLVLCYVRHHLLFLLLTLFALFLTYLGMDNSAGLLIGKESIAITPLLLVDSSVVLFSKLTVLGCMAVAFHAYRYFGHKERHVVKVEEFYLLLLMACLGALVLIGSFHFAGFFLGLEIMSISLFALIAYPLAKTPSNNYALHHSLEAAMKYLVLSSIASAFLLLGIAFLYAQTGTLSLAGLQQYFYSAAQLSGVYISAALLLLLVGVGFKLSLVPFHWWTPDVYQGAPTPVTALVATVAKGAVVVALMRYFVVTGAIWHSEVLTVLTVIVVATMLVGNLLALTQHNIKRLLAYSSIAHVGYLFVAFLAVTGFRTADYGSFSLEAIAIYIVAYFVTTLGAFAVVSAVSDQRKYVADVYDLRHYRGLFWRAPWITVCFILMLLSLAGIPLTLGFIGKFYLFAAGAKSGLWGLLLAIVLGSAIGLYYYLRVIIVLVQKESAEGLPGSTVSAGMDAALIFGLTTVLVVFGVYPTPLIDWVSLQ